MITKFKIYEEIYIRPREIKIGDYIIASNLNFSDVAISDEKSVTNYLQNHIGEVIGLAPILVKYEINDNYILKVIGEQFKIDGKNAVIEIRSNEIPIWSDNKIELEMYIQSKKYNL